jgi:hypothetical protein
VRKEPKGHGTGQWLEGRKAIADGARVAILEDVVTTGASTLKAIERAEVEGLKVAGAFALLWARIHGLVGARPSGGRPVVYLASLGAMWVLGLIYAFVHGKDAYAAMPERLYLSALVAILALVAAWLGYSVGRWEKDVFVVESSGFNENVWLDNAGVPATEQLKVTERFVRKDFGHMDIEITIDDPKTYTKKWEMVQPLLFQADNEIIEYICDENNRYFLLVPDAAPPGRPQPRPK